MRHVLAVLLFGLSACGHDSATPPPRMEAIEVGPSHSFNKHGDELTAIEVVQAHPAAWEPFTDPIWKLAGFRVRQDAGAVPQRLTVTRRWSSRASSVDELGVAPGGYYLDSGDLVHVITTPPTGK